MMQNRKRTIHRWIRRSFVLWAVFSTLWLANSFRTRGVPAGTLKSSPSVSVVNGSESLQFLPASSNRAPALIFFCGSGVSANAYAPLLRPIAETGHAVFVVKLPWRFAPLETHKRGALERARTIIVSHPEIPRWVISGHSLGGALACRFVQTDPDALAAMVLIGTTHPKQDDLSNLKMPVIKVSASNDGVAPPGRMHANARLLPNHTKWVEIKGGNHSQFGHYGRQLLDGRPAVTRETQQELTRSAILEVLARPE